MDINGNMIFFSPLSKLRTLVTLTFTLPPPRLNLQQLITEIKDLKLRVFVSGNETIQVWRPLACVCLLSRNLIKKFFSPGTNWIYDLILRDRMSRDSTENLQSQLNCIISINNDENNIIVNCINNVSKQNILHIHLISDSRKLCAFVTAIIIMKLFYIYR